MNLMKGHNEWANRPADQRFDSLHSLLSACKTEEAATKVKPLNLQTARVELTGGDLRLIGQSGIPARMTHWAFGQVCTRAKAPASYMRTLPPELVAKNLNHGLAKAEDDDQGRALLHVNGDVTLRALTSERYARVWDGEIVERLSALQADGWRVPPARPAFANQPGTRPATEADILPWSSQQGLGVKVGDLIAPAGLYRSDHDMFVMMVNEDRRIADGAGGYLSRGFFAWNSEVGAKTFGLMTYMYDFVCGNLIVWNARNVKEITVRHVGNARDRAFPMIRAELVEYADDAATEIEAKISRARSVEIAATKDEVLTAVFGRKLPGLTKSIVASAYDAAEQSPRYGSPRSVWGMVNGLTEVSQRESFTDERITIDQSAGRLLDMVDAF